jgi:hypothetical protein
MTAIAAVSLSNAHVTAESYSLESGGNPATVTQRVKVELQGYNSTFNGLIVSLEGTSSSSPLLDDLLDRSSEDTFTITIEKN